VRRILSKKEFAEQRMGRSVRHLSPSAKDPRSSNLVLAQSESPKPMAKLGSPRVALCRRDGATQRQRDPNPTGLARGAIGDFGNNSLPEIASFDRQSKSCGSP
jgi:hypothetical protein